MNPIFDLASVGVTAMSSAALMSSTEIADESLPAAKPQAKCKLFRIVRGDWCASSSKAPAGSRGVIPGRSRRNFAKSSSAIRRPSARLGRPIVTTTQRSTTVAGNVAIVLDVAIHMTWSARMPSLKCLLGLSVET